MHLEQGRCVCDTDWQGILCDNYVGRCSQVCYQCVGPSDTDCTYCVQNAYMNIHGRCVCNHNWHGPACTKYGSTSQPPPMNSTEPSSSGTGDLMCHPRCADGCTGPTTYDCISCAPRSHRAYYEECVCDEGWSGSDCSTYQPGYDKCHDRCLTCSGPSVFDCLECNETANKNAWGI
jgi:hypothetical protein